MACYLASDFDLDVVCPTQSVPFIPPPAAAATSTLRFGGVECPRVGVEPQAAAKPHARGAAAERPRPGSLRGLWRRLVRHDTGRNEDIDGGIQCKNTFVHFDEPHPEGQPPHNTAPGALACNCKTQSTRSIASSSVSTQSSLGSFASDTSSAGDSTVQVMLASFALDRSQAVGLGRAAAAEMVKLSEVLACQHCNLASVGSAGHDCGNCMPCLMQVRWQAGKCAEPCKFGLLCGRCHEAHTEEQLQKIQAKMRRQKKKFMEDSFRAGQVLH